MALLRKAGEEAGEKPEKIIKRSLRRLLYCERKKDLEAALVSGISQAIEMQSRAWFVDYLVSA